MFKKDNYLLVATTIFFIVSVAFTQAPKEESVPPPGNWCYVCVGDELACEDLVDFFPSTSQGMTNCQDYSVTIQCQLYGYYCTIEPGGET